MKAFILAAGKGDRLLPLTRTIPKPLLPVLGRPMICYTLARLRHSGINKLIINISYLGDMIKEFFEYHNNFGFDIHFSEETNLLGTGGAIKNCEKLLTKPFFLLNADILTDLDLFEFLRNWSDSSQNSILALSNQSMENKFSVAVKDDQIVDFSGLAGSDVKDNHDYIGQAILSPKVFEYLPEGKSALTSNGLMGLMKNGKLGYYQHKSWWFDTGTHQRLQNAENFLKTKNDLNLNLVQEKVEPRLSYLYRLYKNVVEV